MNSERSASARHARRDVVVVDAAAEERRHALRGVVLARPARRARRAARSRRAAAGTVERPRRGAARPGRRRAGPRSDATPIAASIRRRSSSESGRRSSWLVLLQRASARRPAASSRASNSAGVAGRELDHPALARRATALTSAGLVGERAVDRDHLAGDRARRESLTVLTASMTPKRLAGRRPCAPPRAARRRRCRRAAPARSR